MARRPGMRQGRLPLVHIVTSDDGNLRLYGWDPCDGGTMISYEGITQYRANGKVYTIPHHIDNRNVDYDDGEFHVSGVATRLWTFECEDGSTLYVAFNGFREWSSMSYDWLAAYAIKGDSIADVEAFEKDKKCTNSVDLEYNPIEWWEWYGNWDYFFALDTINKTFYVPKVGDGWKMLKGQYDTYRFDGQKFVFDGVRGAFWKN